MENFQVICQNNKTEQTNSFDCKHHGLHTTRLHTIHTLQSAKLCQTQPEGSTYIHTNLINPPKLIATFA